MPLLEDIRYQPRLWYKNGHSATLLTYSFRKIPEIKFSRKRIITPDEDFIDLDLSFQNSRVLVILCHGLEGSSGSQYMVGMTKYLSDRNVDVCAMNYRSCSGEMNNQARFYHSGATDDLHLVISEFESQYDEIHLVGFSLGGNLVLKYGGEKLIEKSKKIKSISAISVPCDLTSSIRYFSRPGNFIYENGFLSTLKEKIRLKAKKFPEIMDLSQLKKVKTLYDFDNVYTAPLHGYRDAEDYYEQCSSLYVLQDCPMPIYILNAIDDPFLPHESFPYQIAKSSDHIHLETTRYGGHVSYCGLGTNISYADIRIFEFISENSEIIPRSQ